MDFLNFFYEIEVIVYLMRRCVIAEACVHLVRFRHVFVIWTIVTFVSVSEIGRACATFHVRDVYPYYIISLALRN